MFELQYEFNIGDALGLEALVRSKHLSRDLIFSGQSMPFGVYPKGVRHALFSHLT